MELYVFAESGEFLGVIDLFSSLRWRRRYWEPGEVELHLPATEENIALLQPGVILRRVDRKESARVMGIDIKGYELTVSARMLSIYFGKATPAPRLKSCASLPKMPTILCLNWLLTAPTCPQATPSQYSWISKTR